MRNDIIGERRRQRLVTTRTAEESAQPWGLDFRGRCARVRTDWGLRRFFLCGGIAALVLSGLAIAGASERVPTVVVLHSYHHGFTWTDNISDGIRQAVGERGRRVDLRFEFMDTRRVYSQEYYARLRDALAVKYAGVIPDVVICSDDNALDFILEHGEAVFGDAPAVFCSVSGLHPEMRTGRELTGLVEAIDIEETLELALKLHPDTREVVVITDMTRTGQALRAKAEDVLAPYGSRLAFTFLDDMLVEDVIAEVSKLSRGTIILQFIFSQDRSGKVFSHEEILARFAAESPVPIYAVWEFYLGAGIVGGKLTNGRIEGAMVGRIAMDIVDGARASEIPLAESPRQYMFDWRQLQRFGISTDLLPDGSSVIHKPFSFYETYTTLFWSVVVVIAALLSLSTFLVVNVVLRRRAERALRASERKYRTLIETTAEGWWLLDARSRTVETNAALRKMLGYTAAELADSNPLDFVTEDSRPLLEQQLNMVPSTVHRRYEVAFRHKDGRVVDALVSGTTLRSDSGKLLGSFGLFSDITDRKAAEDRLHRSEENLTITLNSIGDAVVATDENGVIRRLNPNAEELTGWTADEAVGRPFDSVVRAVDAESREPLESLVEVVVRTGEVCHLGDDVVLIDRTGQEKRIADSGAPIRNSSGSTVGVVLVLRDVTEEHALQQQLRQSQKMEAVGQLAGGVAHDFNNILQAILGYGEMALSTVKRDSPVYERVEQVMLAADRASVLVRQLLAFSRRQVLEMESLDLDEVITDHMKMIRRVIGEHIMLDVVPGKDLETIRADRGQIAQILTNLCVNARDAMPEGGTITLETESVRIDEEFCDSHPWAVAGRYTLLSVTDTGCGIEEENLGHIFEPFFTTKEVGRGTGLGLSTVYGLVQQHGGLVQVESEVGRGSTFKIYFPAAGPSNAAVSDSDREQAPSGTETILLAEDDAMVRDVCRHALEEAGYTVLAAADGKEALRFFADFDGRIHLALLDVVMPKVGGMAVFDHIRVTHPDVKVLFASGYSLNADGADFVLDEGLALITKPYRYSDLLRRVREVLDAEWNPSV